MADIEKVIKGLEHCTRPFDSGKRTDFCMGCPYWSPIGFNQFICTSQRLKKDALELLKEYKELLEVVQMKKFDADPLGE